MAALRRYWRHFNLAGAILNLSKEQLVDIVRRHFKSQYIKHPTFYMAKRGWNVVVSNHRGLGGVPLTSDFFYNGVWMNDLRRVVKHIRSQSPDVPLFVVGISLGANMMVKYIGEDGDDILIDGAAAVCCPWDLLLCDRFIGRNAVQRVYNKALGAGLKRYAKKHQEFFTRLSNWADIEKARRVREFDTSGTCIVGKFDMADIYYRESSCAGYVTHVKDVVLPLHKELKKGYKGLIQDGSSPRLIKKVFETVRNMVIKRIKESAISMKDFDMKDILSTFFATQLSTKLFGPFQKHIANIIVGAVHATGYDYEDIGPFDASISDFEDGFDLIGINKVSGGSVGDSFLVEGIAFKSTASRVHGFEKLEVVENPKILLLNIIPDGKSKKKDQRDDENIIDILDKYVKICPNVVLSRQAIDGDAKKQLAERGIYFADLVAEDDIVRVAAATRDEVILFNNNYFSRIHIGTCKQFQQKKFGNEVFGIFSGCSRGKAATIVLRGNDQFIEEAEMYVEGLIPYARRVMKDYTLVVGGRALYDDIIRYVSEEANNVDEDSKPIIKAFTKAIQTVSDKTCGNVGCNAVNNPSQKHAVAIGEGDTMWEPPALKIDIIGLATQYACFKLGEIIRKDDKARRKTKHKKKRKRC